MFRSAQNFFLALPIPMVDLLGKCAEVRNVVWLVLTRDLVLDPIWESVVEAPMESSMTPISDLACQAVPFYNILGDPLTIVHLQLLELSFSVSYRVMGTKVSL